MAQQSATVIPLRKNVIDTFAKADNILYAKHDNGAVYVSNGYYILKTNQEGLDYLTAQVNRRRRTSVITVRENKRILDYVKNAKGTFELTQKPYERELNTNCTVCFYADDKQYFAYDKRFIDILRNYDNRLFVDDNNGYDMGSHSMVAKSQTGEVLGFALPIRLPDEMYEKLADVLPLKIKWKSEIDRIKENPTHDPYIGKELFTGKDHVIVSAIRKINGVDMYVVPKVENGKVLGGGDLIKADEIAEHISRWNAARKQPGIGQQMASGAKQAAAHNAAKPAPEKGGKVKNER